MPKKVAIIGAGPGGLATAMRLLASGYQVDIFEKNSVVGGRTSKLSLGNYSFDLGPSSLTMPHQLTSLFINSHRSLHHYLTLLPIDPLYRLFFPSGKTFAPSGNQKATLRELNRVFPGNETNFYQFMSGNAKKILYLTPLLDYSFGSLIDFLRPTMLRAIPSLSIGRTLIDETSKYFEDEELQLAFTFQMKYMGMSPWEIPGIYSVLPFSEYYYGSFHPTGGQSQILQAMQTVIEEYHGRIHLNSGVAKIHTSKHEITGIELQDGRSVQADHYIVNADLSYAIKNLFVTDKPLKFKTKIPKKKYSASAFVIYLGLNTLLPIDHQTVLFPENYKVHTDETTNLKVLSDDFSIHITNPSVTDTTMAPIGHSAIRIMVPVPNNESQIDWDQERKSFRNKIFETVKTKLQLDDLEKHIVEEHVITPKEWEKDFHIHLGAVFGMMQSFRQTGMGNPVNQLHKQFKNLFIVGTSAHTGTSLPYIMESAKYAVKRIVKKDAKNPDK
ncbi:phytoene desaturase family protein [Listeria valentina]|uniref:phytoene desaturase family protein n=1 Tax=Listeria valentina TaxID=2705293 RepID=UPI001FE84834|nr:phytoene desaturase family protein [Listeria valentina]